MRLRSGRMRNGIMNWLATRASSLLRVTGTVLLLASCAHGPQEVHPSGAGHGEAGQGPVIDSELPTCEAQNLYEPRTCQIGCSGNSRRVLVCSGAMGAGEIFRPDSVPQCRWSSPWSDDLWVHMSLDEPNRQSDAMRNQRSWSLTKLIITKPNEGASAEDIEEWMTHFWRAFSDYLDPANAETLSFGYWFEEKSDRDSIFLYPYSSVDQDWARWQDYVKRYPLWREDCNFEY